MLKPHTHHSIFIIDNSPLTFSSNDTAGLLYVAQILQNPELKKMFLKSFSQVLFQVLLKSVSQVYSSNGSMFLPKFQP